MCQFDSFQNMNRYSEMHSLGMLYAFASSTLKLNRVGLASISKLALLEAVVAIESENCVIWVLREMSSPKNDAVFTVLSELLLSSFSSVMSGTSELRRLLGSANCMGAGKLRLFKKCSSTESRRVSGNGEMHVK